VTFSQKEGAIADDMIETIRQLGIEPWVNRNHSPYVHFGFAHMGFWSWLRRNCGTCSKEKKVPRIVFCLPSIEIEEFLDTLVSGDGSRNPAGSEGSFWYSTISKQLNDDLHDLCLRVGIVLSSRCDTFSNPMWNPSYDSYGHYAEVLTYLPERTQEVDYDGKIVCFSVPNETLITRRNGRVLISGNSQYQCDTEAMKGEVFAYDDCQQIGEADFPKDAELRLYMGVDLAAQAEERHSMFSISVIGLLGSILKDDYRVYLVDFYLDHLKATKQPEKVLEFYDRWTPLRVGIETVQYQELLADLVRELRPGMVVEKIPTSQDKLLRAWKIAPLFENKRVFFKRAVQMRAIDHLVRFPDGRFTGDMFDSLDHALRAAKRGIRRPRRERPSFGLL
jgi:phage terminase large subunit-like protein